MTKVENKIWFITGISRGFGLELAKAVLAEGDVVIGTSRDGKTKIESAPETQHVLPLEITTPGQAAQVVKQAFSIHGRIDVIVNNAGYGLLGAVEEAGIEESRHLFEVNFFGPLQIIQAALPFLRVQRKGHIINISSIAGLAPNAGSGLYAATKFALGGMSESLAQDVAPLGIHVTVVEPGAFRTDFLSAHSIRKTDHSIGDYNETSGKTIAYLDQIAGKQQGDPVLGARAIIQAVQADRPPLHLVIGSDAMRRTRNKLQQFTAELDLWEKVSLSTDFAG
jgi:NAD(P)-dependent dehydrogenase (short-subunit alcohol dehydrogenase family)